MFRKLNSIPRLLSRASTANLTRRAAVAPIYAVSAVHPQLELDDVRRYYAADHFKPYLQFIQKNKVIPNALANLNNEQSKMTELMSAIDRGDAAADIFDDPNCYLYVMYLQQNNKISLSQAMTLHVYLMALMQFTERQPLKAMDADVKSIREYFNSSDRFIQYLRVNSTVTRSKILKSLTANLAEEPAERLAVLLYKVLNTSNISDYDKKYFNLVIKLPAMDAMSKRKAAIQSISSLKTYQSPEQNPDRQAIREKIRWEVWEMLLNKSSDSEFIWKKATKYLHDDLLALIIDYNLKFYHPYYPMTPDLYQTLKKLVQSELTLLNNHKQSDSALTRAIKDTLTVIVCSVLLAKWF